MFAVEGQAPNSAKWKRIAQLNLSLLMFCMSANAIMQQRGFLHICKYYYGIGVFVND